MLYRTSVKGRRDLAKSLLLGNDETKVHLPEYYESRVAEIFSVILKSLGLKLEFIDEDEVIREYDDTSLKVFVLDGVEYFCTEYQFMLVKRRKEIEKEILSKCGVMDRDELQKQVIEELTHRDFIIGPDVEDVPTTPAYQPDTVERYDV